MNSFVPLFRKEENTFFVLLEDFVGEDEWEASMIGLGSMLVECILLEMEYTGETKEIDLENIPHRKADLGGLPVAIISGPLFDEALISEDIL